MEPKKREHFKTVRGNKTCREVRKLKIKNSWAPTSRSLLTVVAAFQGGGGVGDKPQGIGSGEGEVRRWGPELGSPTEREEGIEINPWPRQGCFLFFLFDLNPLFTYERQTIKRAASAKTQEAAHRPLTSEGIG